MKAEMINSLIDILTIYVDKLKKEFSIYDLNLKINNYEDMVEFFINYKDDNIPNKKTDAILIRMHFLEEYNQIQISNIFIPPFMKHRGIGKTLINIVFLLATMNCYDLFLIDMVPSFYSKMIKRGAIPCGLDAVQIVDKTNLMP